jgi:hypothetical protein
MNTEAHWYARWQCLIEAAASVGGRRKKEAKTLG